MEDLYETDFYRWKQQQKEHLVNRRFDPLDLERVIEEFDDRGVEESVTPESLLLCFTVPIGIEI